MWWFVFFTVDLKPAFLVFAEPSSNWFEGRFGKGRWVPWIQSLPQVGEELIGADEVKLRDRLKEALTAGKN